MTWELDLVEVGLNDVGSFPPTRLSVARELGPRVTTAQTDPGALPLVLHESLTRDARGDLRRSARLEAFSAGGADFWWLTSRPGDGRLDGAVRLDGHRVVTPSRDVRTGIEAALAIVAGRSWAFDLVSSYVTTFALVGSDTGERTITSCSLPDFPMCVFFSPRVFVHIPPLSVSRTPSARLAAENIYHEAVHQTVNHWLISREILAADYDSAHSPRVQISWRRAAAEPRNREWELDRVLHAAAVYCQLMRWRHAELSEPGISPEDRALTSSAAAEATAALAELCGALTRHQRCFTARGRRLVERLVDTSRQRIDAVTELLDRRSISG